MEVESVMNDSRTIESISSAFVGESCDQVIVYYVVPKDGIGRYGQECEEITPYHEADGSIWFAARYKGGGVDRVNSRDVALVKYDPAPE